MAETAVPDESATLLAEETRALLASLTGQRRHVLGILEGLPDEALRRPALPSGWTCLGLVQHLALDVERFWFRAVIAGEQVELKSGDAAWQVADDVPAEAVFDLYRDEIDRADEIIRAGDLDAGPAWWPEDMFGGQRAQSLRETILHVITETACHAGHLDAARELTDGRTWLVLTD
ncbi:DinB family protein [Micromonospora sp. NPDC049559]|uniref:DinB family protein n=1 Tax=Micromonospora sp. NPDC049559 TaxID=3155923 RepID=UPI003434EBC8